MTAFTLLTYLKQRIYALKGTWIKKFDLLILKNAHKEYTKNNE